MASQRAAEQRGGIGPDAIEGCDFARERQQQEGFANPARRRNQRSLCLGYSFDQPAALLGLPDVCRAPAVMSSSRAAEVAIPVTRLGGAQQRLDIETFSHRIGGIPFSQACPVAR